MSGGAGSVPGSGPAGSAVRSERGALAAVRREWPLAVTLGGALAGLLVAVMFDRFRRGVVLMAAAVIFAGWLRALLPESRMGLLRVRSRRIDVASLFALGVGLLVLALAVPGVA